MVLVDDPGVIVSVVQFVTVIGGGTVVVEQQVVIIVVIVEHHVATGSGPGDGHEVVTAVIVV
jgi:hypothetical protein